MYYSFIAEEPMHKDTDEETIKFLPENCLDCKSLQYKNLQKFCDNIEIIIHVVNDREFRAALQYLKPPNDDHEKPVGNFPDAPFVIGKFAEKKVVLVQTPAGDYCEDKIKETVKKFKNARYILLVGVGYAFDRQKYKLGDVLVSDSICDMRAYRENDDDSIQNRGEIKHVNEQSPFLYDTFCGLMIQNPPFPVSKIRNSKVHKGQFISRSVLVDNQKKRDLVRKSLNDFPIGGEMEGGRVQKMIGKENNIKGVIIIKSVVDFADGNKEKGWQFTGAKAAFHYTESKLKAVNLPACKYCYYM